MEEIKIPSGIYERKPLTDKQKEGYQKSSSSLKNKPKSNIHKQHLSESKKGKPVSEKSLNNLKIGRSMPKSESHRNKIGAAHKGKIVSKKSKERMKHGQYLANQNPEIIEHKRNAQRKYINEHPEKRQIMSDFHLKRFIEHPTLKEEISKRNKILLNTPEINQKLRKPKSDIHKKHISESRKKLFKNDPEASKRLSASQLLANQKPEIKLIRSKSQIKRYENPIERELNKERQIQVIIDHPELRERNSKRNKILLNTPEIKEKMIQGIKKSHIEKFWYGNVNYDERKQYCEKWNRDLWNRIDACQNFKSILSDKTKENNDGHALSRHHVYWQEKACCIWDEDAQGYYAMINLGTVIKPQMYKHYIKGDPNKFVLLTREEHGLIKGNKKLGTNKLTWIKILEDLIEAKLHGKCYYTKEEYKLFENQISTI